MKLAPDWRRVLSRAWSLRFIELAEIILNMVPAIVASARRRVGRTARGWHGTWRSRRARKPPIPKLNKKAVAAVAAVALSIGSLIKPWEGLSLSSYPDIVGVWAACYSETKGNQTLTETMAVDDVMSFSTGGLPSRLGGAIHPLGLRAGVLLDV